MPYESQAQRRFFHTDTAKEQGITPAMVAEYDHASKGTKLPARVDAAKRSHRQRLIREHLDK